MQSAKYVVVQVLHYKLVRAFILWIQLSSMELIYNRLRNILLEVVHQLLETTIVIGIVTEQSFNEI